jgi:hypothetical protein
MRREFLKGTLQRMRISLQEGVHKFGHYTRPGGWGQNVRCAASGGGCQAIEA